MPELSVGVLVPTHDGYSDLWPIQAELWRRFWPDRSWPVYWMTNGAKVPDLATPLTVPKVQRTDWGKGVEIAAFDIPHDLVVFWFEEIFLLSKVPNDLFLEAAEHMRCNPDVGIVQLTRYYCQPQPPTMGNFMDYPKDKPGFSSSLPAMFRKDVLLHLLRTLPRSNDFEQQSARVLERDMPAVRSLISCQPMMRICDNALIAGPWKQCAVKHLGELGIDVDFSIRGISPDACDHMEGIAP